VVLRVWRARAHKARREAYPEHFRLRVATELRALPGFLGATLSSRDVDHVVEFTVVTRWASMDAVGGFAGARVERAVVEPEAVAALIDYDRTVTHLTVLEQVEAAPASAPGAGTTADRVP
jgi:heme-degrading monooxygenase HmoA